MTPPPERRWICMRCPLYCAYYSRDIRMPSDLDRPCLRHKKKTVTFREV